MMLKRNSHLGKLWNIDAQSVSLCIYCTLSLGAAVHFRFCIDCALCVGAVAHFRHCFYCVLYLVL
jgi:hypothetical protein